MLPDMTEVYKLAEKDFKNIRLHQILYDMKKENKIDGYNIYKHEIIIVGKTERRKFDYIIIKKYNRFDVEGGTISIGMEESQ